MILSRTARFDKISLRIKELRMPEDLSLIISQMTLEEKAALCTGATAWTSTPVEHLGIPELIVSDGPHGVRKVPDANSMAIGSLPATCFPTASCLASTWNRDLIRKMGEALGEECIALNVDVLLGPGANMKRSPLGGRNFEYFSEDPYLAGEMAVNMINGVQSKGVGTSLKHYAANNQEFQRFSINAVIDERSLREIYLAAFEKAVKEAQPWTVMCSYNKVNGTFSSQNHYLLTDILKKEWGFEGLVVSDWGAVRDRIAALKAGLDWEMPGPQDRRVKAVVEAVRNGDLDEAVLNESVRRILNIAFRAKKTPKNGSFDADAHHELAHKIAGEGVVLLKNNGLLPLKAQEHIAVIGHSAENAHFQGGGSSHINPTKVAVPFNEIKNQATDAELIYAPGYPMNDTFQQGMIDEAVTVARTADVAVLFIALPSYKESEGYDRTDLDLTAQQVALIKAVSKVQPKTVVVINNGAPVVMGDWINNVAAVIEGWMMGQAGGIAIADILFGKINPSGKLAETFPMRLEDTPAFINWPGETGAVNYGEGLFIGYRYYDTKNVPVLFPFGHGLSYTTFEYSHPKVSAPTFKDVDGVTVTVDVTNTGKLAGAEIVQVYVHDRESSLVRPEKELKGFAKVYLEPGETKTVSVKLDFRSFAFYNVEYKQWITETGEFDILIAASSADIRQKLIVKLESTLDLPCVLDMESTIREWVTDKRGNAVITPLIKNIVEMSRQSFGSDQDQDGIGMDTMEMFYDMPLVSVLLFNQQFLTMPSEDMVEGMLRQVHAMK
jgi:beta-glucosidase